MEKSEEKIIDLVDVIAEPDPSRIPERAPIRNSEEKTAQKPPEQNDFEKIVHKEVEQTLRSMVGEYIQTQIDFEKTVKQQIEQSLRSRVEEHIQNIIKEVLAQEIQKAISREIEGLKKNK